MIRKVNTQIVKMIQCNKIYQQKCDEKLKV